MVPAPRTATDRIRRGEDGIFAMLHARRFLYLEVISSYGGSRWPRQVQVALKLEF